MLFGPVRGWVAWVEDEEALVYWDGSAWSAFTLQAGGSAGLFGINTTADATNRLAVKSDAALFSHDDVTPGSGDMQIKINKEAAADTASLLYQTGYSGRAEFGLSGDDDFHIKVSPDGTTWHEAIVVDRAGGHVRMPAGLVTPQVTVPALAAKLVTAADIKAVVPFALSPSELANIRYWEQGTSWYWEDLNTSTRGRQRRFPARGEVVARAGSVTIYDATDLDGGVPRMWRVLDSSSISGGLGVFYALATTHPPTDVEMSGSTLLVTLEGDVSPDRAGVHYFDFAADVAGKVSRTTAVTGEVSPLVRYVDTPITPSTRFAPILSGATNAVDARVYPGAPLDDYGRPVPIIAVATAAGASVIHPDGRVVDITGQAYVSVAFAPDGGILLARGGATDTVIEKGPLPYADVLHSSWYTDRWSDVGVGTPLLDGGVRSVSPGAIGQTTGLTLISSGVRAHITKDYATGWMVGDCKLATLCDGTTGAITGGTVPDRSGAGNTLTVNGTLSRTALPGSDAVVWSGFSAANYLSMATDADFDMGSDDFTISMWATITGAAGSRFLMERGTRTGGAGTTGGRFFLVTDESSRPRFQIGDGTNSAQATATTAIAANTWVHVVAQRRGSNVEIWVNGVREAVTSAASVGSLDNADAPLIVGGGYYGGAAGFTTGQLVLTRISKGVSATPDQIRKMYRDERARLNGYGLLGGTSNNVTSISEDPTTGTLTAGAGDGASEFLALRRIAYHDGASTGGLMTSDSVVAVGSAGGYTAIGTAAEAIVLRDAVDVVDEATDHEPDRPIAADGVTTSATPLVLSPRLYVAEGERIRGRCTVIGTRYNDQGERFSVDLVVDAYRAPGGNVALGVPAADQRIGLSETTGSMDAVIVADTEAQTIAPQATGLSTTPMEWVAVYHDLVRTKELTHAA